MNLVQTVYKILGKEVTEDEAKDFALNQYGVLCAFNRKWEEHVRDVKEPMVFLCDANDFNSETGLEIEGYLETGTWDGTEDKAKEFMNHARENERAYTLKGFQEAINQQYEDNLMGSFIFITNNY